MGGLIPAIKGRFHGDVLASVKRAAVGVTQYRDMVSIIRLVVALTHFCAGASIADWVQHRLTWWFVCHRFSRGDHLEIGPIKLPMLAKRDRRGFVFQFWDLIFPGWVCPGRYGNEGDGLYEEFGVTVEPGDVVVDCGANLGVFAAYAASKGARVFAFEPYPKALGYLTKTVELNRSLPGSIEIVPMALMAERSQATFAVDIDNVGGSSAVLCRRGSPTFVATSVPLDEWLPERGISQVHFIKADVEGAERSVVQGALRTIERWKPRLSICTYHLADDRDVLGRLVLRARPDYQMWYGPNKLYAR